MKKLTYMMSLLLLISCSTTKSPEFSGERVIAEESNCAEGLKKFFKNEVTEDELTIALKERKLISFTDKFIILNHPKLDWINETKRSLLSRIKNWNKNQYPLFYLDTEANVLPLAKSYADLISKEVAGSLDDEGKKSLENIRSMLSAYQNYQKDLDNLLEERISLQYNLNMLKDIKLSKDETRDIKLTIKKDGVFTSEIITLRKSDRNIDLVKNSLEAQIKELDGKFNSVGKIHERVLSQAMLKDMLTIIQRELEYSVKNATEISPELTKSLEDLEKILADNAFEPSSFGVYKITNQVFKTEVYDLFNFTNPIKKIVNENHIAVRKYIEKFFKKSGASEVVQDVEKSTIDEQTKLASKIANPSEIQKDGPIKKLYAKIATFTPYQKFMASTKLSLIGYGAYRFFWFKEDPKNPVEVTASKNGEVVVVDPLHQQAVEGTKKVSDENSQGNSKVIEIHLENLWKKSPN
jgi:hypothetical protein